jgi:2-hydroxy-3-oxopropionate reductase
MTTIGFVGLGRMGGAMAVHLVEAGHRVLGVDPSAEAKEAALSSGVEVVPSLSNLTVSVLMSSLPGDDEVREVYLGGLFDLLEPDALCIDLSTIGVATSQEIAGTAARAGHRFLDCPVSGTSVHARAGTLVVMAGGDPAWVEEARPLLEPFAASIRHLGPNGANRLLNAHLVAIAEALTEMEAAGIDTGVGLELLRQGAVPRLLDYKAGPMAERDHDPLFTVDLMAKDLGLADERRAAGSVTAAAAAVLRRAQDRGWGPSDISAVIEVLSA